MDNRGMSAGFAACTHTDEGACCFRDFDTRGLSTYPLCNALCNTKFSDGYCHFRKKTIDGPNEYDRMRENRDATELTLDYILGKLKAKYGVEEGSKETLAFNVLSTHIEDIFKEFSDSSYLSA